MLWVTPFPGPDAESAARRPSRRAAPDRIDGPHTSLHALGQRDEQPVTRDLEQIAPEPLRECDDDASTVPIADGAPKSRSAIVGTPHQFQPGTVCYLPVGPNPPALVVWYTTWMRITRSARRHDISEEAIRHAVNNAVRMVEVEDGLFLIGADASGQMLELVARSTEDGELVVFHAMTLRPVNATRYLR